ncbi:Luciferase-like monooxygenase [Jatrophihabitans endophyticus]|uniref:Luciferase-like monooxygenase n=1 Tax=Jatrophihabitans endophyticus TaxID=1206085 RepID=A0A1M5GA70_9ACTN|nr:LLM class flavin-dependent oxidoreductase [Jatrophihabitans endophyticus]SHG00633.1 Luciferase-like monooxygenase [Jatrophihabitans endophyticus]
MTTLGVIFPPSRPPEELREVAVAADDAGVEQLWLWEDCFFESGVAAAAAALGWTQRIAVGIGLMPVPLRNVALTAMEIATIERLFPGRFVPGIGHGVLDWMGQVGARAASPMTLLREYGTALRALLHGETVSTDGRYVQLEDVALDWPPSPAPPLLVGAVGPKTLELATEVGDGVILTGATTPQALRDAAEPLAAGQARSGRAAADVVVFVTVTDRAPAAEIAARVGDYAAAGATHVALHAVGDDSYPLPEFAALVGREVRPAVR